ncbi:hypothetical protein Bhyg_03894 [Pseudolycoriella hygida]|uniref:F-box domain-containing protein n=1 Tax=Pseudolycoriella hygida TaxID=35572 RepID=A0A9Q0NE57_9DIPT|nr:hypothetical protein Bhyg_03894 [Pseudolycoriella hygida]
MAKYIRSTYARLPIFYDDDGRRIKTVYVSNIRERTTIESLENKYSVYGPVQSCVLKRHADNDELYAIVTMDYAFDASKILRDWPNEAKHLYSLLPKRVTKHLTNKSSTYLPKKQIIQRMNRIEVPVYKMHLQKCPQPSVAVMSQQGSQKNEPEIAPPVSRRRRIVKTSTKRMKAPVNEVEPTNKTQRRNRAATPEQAPESRSEVVVPLAPIDTSTNEQDESNAFTSLNDDCLISIFCSCDKLDIVNLAQVCQRFRFIVYNYLRVKIAKIVDLSKIKSISKLTIGEATKFLRFIDAAKSTQQLELIMSSFDDCNDELILEKTLKCCGPNLNCITFKGFSFVEGFLGRWKHLLHGLKILVFHQCILPANHFDALLKFCENLEVLTVSNSSSINSDSNDELKIATSEFNCTKLQEFRLISSRNCSKSSELIWLLENNANLCVLQMSDVGDSVKLSGEILERIGRYEKLQELAISFQNFAANVLTNLHHLIRLKELKSLGLQCDWMNISPFVKQFSQAANKQIESLSFDCIDLDTSFVKSIGRFRKLKFLKLENTIVNEPSQEVFEKSLMDLTFRLNILSRFHCQLHLFTEDSLVQFVERMRKLEHFQISGLVMNLLLFMRFVTACSKRVNGLKLNVVIDNYQYLNEYLDLIRSEYGKVIGIQSLYD